MLLTHREFLSNRFSCTIGHSEAERIYYFIITHVLRLTFDCSNNHSMCATSAIKNIQMFERNYRKKNKSFLFWFHANTFVVFSFSFLSD